MIIVIILYNSSSPKSINKYRHQREELERGGGTREMESLGWSKIEFQEERERPKGSQSECVWDRGRSRRMVGAEM